jgi:hypothetical protein
MAENWKQRPQIGDPQVATDPPWRGPRGIFDPGLQRSSETNVPTQPFQPNPPHSQPPAGSGPKPQPSSEPITPRTTSLPQQPPRPVPRR